MVIKNKNIKELLSILISLILLWLFLVQITACKMPLNIPDDSTVDMTDNAGDVLSGDNDIKGDISDDTISGEESPSLPEAHSIALLPDARNDAEKLSDLSFYDISLEVDFDDASYISSSSIEYTNLEEVPLESLYFRLFPNSGKAYGNGSIEVLTVRVNGHDVETIYSSDKGALEVKLPEPLKAGSKTKIDLDYNGKVPVDFGGGGYGIYNLSQDAMCLSGWYPIIPVYDDEGWNVDPSSAIGDSVFSDMAYYDVQVTAADNMKIISTGNLADSRSLAGGKKQHDFVSGPARDFVLVMGPGFQTVSENIQGTIINVHYRGDDEKISEETLKIAGDCLKTYNSRFGPYPYSELDIVEVPMNGSIGVEFPGIVLFGPLVFGDSIFTSHEIAHQWWYNVVGNDIYDDPWLDEALTSYSSLVYLEDNRSASEFQQVFEYFERTYRDNVNAGGDDVVTEGLGHFEELGGEHYSLIVYVKGALFYHAVREMIGDEAFFKALQGYYQDKKYGIASPGDILGKFEESSGQQLDGLYKEWLYSKK